VHISQTLLLIIELLCFGISQQVDITALLIHVSTHATEQSYLTSFSTRYQFEVRGKPVSVLNKSSCTCVLGCSISVFVKQRASYKHMAYKILVEIVK